MTKFYRDTWACIDLDALAHNYEQFMQLHPRQEMMAVIKANAYGHGDVQVAQLFSDLGATYLAVSSLDEALNLRKHHIKTPILTMAPVKISDLSVAAQFDITVTAYDEEWVKELATTQMQHHLKLHLEVETGMNRTGLRDLAETYDTLSSMSHISVEGIYTHIASADSNLCSVAKQLEAFNCILTSFEPHTFKYIHVANTATALQGQPEGPNMQRVGLGLYGINPDDVFIQTDLDLQPAFSLYARLTQVSKVKKGEAVGYGGTFVADDEICVGTLSIGYADGWSRKNQGRVVLINGYECEIIGRVCMDQLMVKLPTADFHIGDIATLIGGCLPAHRVANELDTIAYEVLTLIGDRVPRIYEKNGAIMDVNLGRFK